MKYIVPLIFAMFTLPFAANAAETLRLGVDPTFAPYESIDKDGNLIGVDIDMGNAICKQLQADCKWVRMDFAGIIPALKAQKIDAALSGMTITPEREKEVLFTVPLNSSPSLMMTSTEQDLDTTVESLEGKVVGIVQGTSQASYANTHWKGKGVKLVSFQNDDLAKQALILGRIDATLQDSVAGSAFLATPEGEGFHLTGTPVINSATGIGLRLDAQDLKQRIDEAVAEMQKSGEYQEIIGKYEKMGLRSTME